MMMYKVDELVCLPSWFYMMMYKVDELFCLPSWFNMMYKVDELVFYHHSLI